MTGQNHCLLIVDKYLKVDILIRTLSFKVTEVKKLVLDFGHTPNYAEGF